MPPVQPNGLDSPRCGQFADLRGRGLHHKGASEIIPTGEATQTEAFQGLPDLLHGHWAPYRRPWGTRRLRNTAAGGGSISRGDVIAFLRGREGALTWGLVRTR